MSLTFGLKLYQPEIQDYHLSINGVKIIVEPAPEPLESEFSFITRSRLGVFPRKRVGTVQGEGEKPNAGSHRYDDLFRDHFLALALSVDVSRRSRGHN